MLSIIALFVFVPYFFHRKDFSIGTCAFFSPRLSFLWLLRTSVGSSQYAVFPISFGRLDEAKCVGLMAGHLPSVIVQPRH